MSVAVVQRRISAGRTGKDFCRWNMQGYKYMYTESVTRITAQNIFFFNLRKLIIVINRRTMLLLLKLN